MNNKIKIAVMFGGRSAEHEVSIMSARSVIAGLDKERFEVIPIAITREGAWLAGLAAEKVLEAGFASGRNGNCFISPGSGRLAICLFENNAMHALKADVVFPVLHGTYGEDGTIQGLFEMADIPFVGCGVCGSAVGMDKVLMKDIWRSNGLNAVPFKEVLRSELEADPNKEAKLCLDEIGLPCFVKPANAGSSVGITKVSAPDKMLEALRMAARFDRKIIVEKAASNPREIELGVIGNDVPECSVPGQIIPYNEFYDYQDKYFSDKDPDIHIPADLPENVREEIIETAKKAWRALDLNGLARVDFLVDNQNRVWLNEVNTMPGFTKISMFNKLWEASGVSYTELLSKLVDFAFERYKDHSRNEVKPL
ncbi:MAG: D-alanine--D-alanine ligase [bacterium]|nr:D-alanine--D-alanine ligase [bacterium]